MFFLLSVNFFLHNQRTRVRNRLSPGRGGRWRGKGQKDKYHASNVNAKTIPVVPVPGIGVGREFKYI
jgi:hypothetical protein